MQLTKPRFNKEFMNTKLGVLAFFIMALLVGVAIGYQLCASDCNRALRNYEQQCKQWQSSGINITEIVEGLNVTGGGR